LGKKGRSKAELESYSCFWGVSCAFRFDLQVSSSVSRVIPSIVVFLTYLLLMARFDAVWPCTCKFDANSVFQAKTKRFRVFIALRCLFLQNRIICFKAAKIRGGGVRGGFGAPTGNAECIAFWKGGFRGAPQTLPPPNPNVISFNRKIESISFGRVCIEFASK